MSDYVQVGDGRSAILLDRQDYDAAVQAQLVHFINQVKLFAAPANCDAEDIVRLELYKESVNGSQRPWLELQEIVDQSIRIARFIMSQYSQFSKIHLLLSAAWNDLIFIFEKRILYYGRS